VYLQAQAFDLIQKGIDFENDDFSWMKMLDLGADNPLLSGLGIQIGRDMVSEDYNMIIIK
jgi:hypothetical protein